MAQPVSWGRKVRLRELGEPPMTLTLAAGDAERAGIARDLGLLGLPRLEADLRLRPWLDGAEVRGTLRATVTYECGVTLDPFNADIEAPLLVRLVPPGSANAVEPQGDLELDPDAEDPPDVLAGDEIDPSAIVVEHLALSLDPFPRKPGAEFEPPPAEAPDSPFAALKALKRNDEGS